MALIDCYECKEKMSSFATSCPNCGAQPEDVDMDEMVDNVKKLQSESIKQIQVSFNRIHDKLFSFNSVFLAAYLVLSTYPKESPVIPLWTAVFPAVNLLILIFLEYRQRGIHRFASKITFWVVGEDEKYGRMIQNQSLLSLLSIVTTIAVFVFIVIKVYFYL
jgi:hypothetical protein